MDDQREAEIRAALMGAGYNELVAAMLAAQENHAQLKATTTAAWREVELIARRIIPDRMEADQIQNITVILPDGSKRQLKVLDQVSVKTPQDKKLALWNWLRDNDAEHLISETVNASSLAGFIREQMRLGDPYPSEICEISTYSTASLVKR